MASSVLSIPLNFNVNHGSYLNYIQLNWSEKFRNQSIIEFRIYRSENIEYPTYYKSSYEKGVSYDYDNIYSYNFSFIDTNVEYGKIYNYAIRAYSVTYGSSELSDIEIGWVYRKTLGTNSDDVIIGNDIDDVIVGFKGDDDLIGLEGNDIIDGGNGNDTLIGGPGNDTIDGGDGNDTAIYQSTYAASTITQNSNGTVTISSLLDGTDTLLNVEYAQFVDRTVSVKTQSTSILNKSDGGS